MMQQVKYSVNIGEMLLDSLNLPSRTGMEGHALATLGRDSSLLIWGRSALPFKGLSMNASALILRVPPGLGPCWDWEGLPSTDDWCWTASGGELEGGEGTGEALGVGCSNLPSRST